MISTKPKLNKKVYYDYKTENKSFLKVARELKRNNIKNFGLPLTLYDKNLIGVDPWDENLSDEIKARVLREAKINIWFYLREIVRVPVPGGKVRYELHRGNLAMTFCMLHNLNTAIMLPRQHYKTYSAVCYYSWIMLLVGSNYTMLFSHKAYSDTVENLKRLKNLFKEKCLPSYILANFGSKNDRDKETEFVLAANNNTIKTLSPPTNRDSASKAGAFK